MTVGVKRRKISLILLAVALRGVAASFPDYPIKPFSEYPKGIEKSGYAVAVTPVEDRKDQKKYFGMDLRSRGLIPVFLVIENRTTGDSIVLRKETLMYSPAGRSGAALADASKSSGVDKTIAVVGKVPTIYTFMATIAAAKNKARRQHLLETELQSTTLSPGQSAHGFIFVPAKRGYSSRKTIQLAIPLARSGTGEDLTIDAIF